MTVLRHSDFRNLFLGQSLSTVGDRIVFVALALYLSAKRLATWRPAISLPSMRDLPKVVQRVKR